MASSLSDPLLKKARSNKIWSTKGLRNYLLLHKNFPLPFPDRVRPDWLFFKTSTIQLTACVFHTYCV